MQRDAIRRDVPARRSDLVIASLSSIMSLLVGPAGAQDLDREERVARCEADALDCNSPGWMFFDGEGGPADKIRARELFTRGCRAGDEATCHNLNFSFFDEGEVKRASYDQACEADDFAACAIAADLRRHGIDGAEDSVQARALYLKACIGGEPIGCSNLGNMIREGEGGPEDEAASLALYQQACALGFTGRCTQAAPAEAAPAAQAEPDPAQNSGQLWCRVDFFDPDPVNKPTYCQDALGSEWEMHWLHPCFGVQGWCEP